MPVNVAVDYRQVTRQAQDLIEVYGLADESATGDALGAWFDRQHQKLVIENSQGQGRRFDLNSYVIQEVEMFVRDKAIKRYGEMQARRYSGRKKIEEND